MPTRNGRHLYAEPQGTASKWSMNVDRLNARSSTDGHLNGGVELPPICPLQEGRLNRRFSGPTTHMPARDGRHLYAEPQGTASKCPSRDEHLFLFLYIKSFKSVNLKLFLLFISLPQQLRSQPARPLVRPQLRSRLLLAHLL